MPAKQANTDILLGYLAKYPQMKTYTIAELIYNENKHLFSSLEMVRTKVRYYRGQGGDARRDRVKTREFMKPLNHDCRKTFDNFKSLAPKLKVFNLPKSIKEILFLSDIHLPYHDEQALLTAIEYGLEKNVDCIWLNGDIMDMFQVSDHEKLPGKADMQYDFDFTRDFFARLRSLFPKAAIYYLEGNHECYDKETEVLTDSGFKLFSDLTESDLVAQFDEHKNITFVKPISYIKKHYEGDMYLIENNYSRQRVTARHEVVIGNEKKLAKDVTYEDVKQLPIRGSVNGINLGVPINDEDQVTLRKITKTHYSDNVYCVEMPLGTVITRLHGKVAFSGNCRWQRYLMRKAPEIIGVSEFRLDVILRLKEFNIEWIPNGTQCKFGHLNVVHGNEFKGSGGVNPARTLFLRAKDNIIAGDKHKTGENNEGTLNGKLITCWAVGALCDLNPEYMSLAHTIWNHGFATISMKPNGLFKVSNFRIKDGIIL